MIFWFYSLTLGKTQSHKHTSLSLMPFSRDHVTVRHIDPGAHLGPVAYTFALTVTDIEPALQKQHAKMNLQIFSKTRHQITTGCCHAY